MTVLSVRRACLEDLPFIAGLVPRIASPDFSPAYYRREQLVTGTIRALRAALDRSSDDELFVIACDAGTQRGFLWANTKRDYFTAEAHGYIEEIAVVDDGCGTGTLLIDYAENWARDRGHRYISLSVRPGNERAKALYERRGYGLDVELRLKLL
jgi:ribosomal protein S18 acetylase RimI-like enzyme